MKEILERLKMDLKTSELARDGLEIILDKYDGDLDINLTLEQLAYIGLGKHLAEQRIDRPAPMGVEEKENEIDIKIVDGDDIGSKKNVYAGGGVDGPIDSLKTERLKVMINGKEEMVFEVYRKLIYRNSKKPVKSASGEDLIVIKGKTDAGVWRAKDVFPKGDKWFVKAWGSSNQRPKRHKFSEKESKDVARKINRDVVFEKSSKNWLIILENDKLDLIYAWLALWNQYPFGSRRG